MKAPAIPRGNAPTGMLIAIERIETATNVRADLGDLEGLADSIRAHGVLQPITVTGVYGEDGKPAGFRVLTGHRRLAAARLAGLEHVPAIFDHRVTNAYTEAMNGILKQINRRGRGYTFPVLRARILHGFRSKPPKGFTVCECCRRDFPVGQVKAKYPMPLDQVALTPGAKLMRLCRECHQSYIAQGFTDHGVST